MRYVIVAAAALLGMTAMSALAQAPAGTNPATGARPGHEPGTGESLPQSNAAAVQQGEQYRANRYAFQHSANPAAGGNRRTYDDG
jgi:hypothetical protein